MTDFFCAQKFTQQQISIVDKTSQSCCKAKEDKVSLEELSTHPVSFFNYAAIQKDREDMLSGHAIPSCDYCWSLESKGLQSRRLSWQSNEVGSTFSIDHSIPEILNLVISNTCQMTCVYCCKKYSHSWLADLVKHGDYNLIDYDDHRFRLETKDKVLHKISQSQSKQTQYYQQIVTQIANVAKHIKVVHITGGEPLISSNLKEILDIFLDTNTKIVIYTGLGINPNQMQKRILDLDPNKISWIISAENFDLFHEFNRYGSNFTQFKTNLALLDQHNFHYRFACSISNISLFGFADFIDHWATIDPTKIYQIEIVYTPEFLSPNVLDPISKDFIIQRLQKHTQTQSLIETISTVCQEKQRKNAQIYLGEFARRRKLSLDIFPDHFVKWLTKQG